MAKGKQQGKLSNEGGACAQKTLLFEVVGNRRVDRETEGECSASPDSRLKRSFIT